MGDGSTAAAEFSILLLWLSEKGKMITTIIVVVNTRMKHIFAMYSYIYVHIYIYMHIHIVSASGMKTTVDESHVFVRFGVENDGASVLVREKKGRNGSEKD